MMGENVVFPLDIDGAQNEGAGQWTVGSDNTATTITGGRPLARGFKLAPRTVGHTRPHYSSFDAHS